ncbi:cytochrome P450 family protein [Planomonospora parontospora]|uniref:cytochrome P450 family protein n=1 Tax=Planomonospora parontospora TaxID=58119 RepID=UPI00166FFD5A|nr:cytochrome P450 [Planomonospora parontospora]GGL58907.1 cytochrome P450 [Planomonospora parontospora subsp. antibiotica]GII20242.1 cytochrome P450 [Planomonospora parontospora subsp. antibiotica]
MSASLADLFTTRDRDAFWSALAAGGPVSRGRYLGGTPIWLVTGYPESLTVLTDPRFSSDVAEQSAIDVAGAAGLPEDVAPYLMRTLGAYDPPDHTRLRRLVSREFTARRVERLHPRIQQIVDDLIVGLPEECDLIEDFAYPLPIQVICELLGIPGADRGVWRGWAADLSAPDLERVATGARGLVGYLAELIGRKRERGGEDLLSALAAVRDRDRLDDEELIAMAVSILIAGHETTVGLLSQSVHLLLTRPDLLAFLRADPQRIPAAVEEFLRCTGPAEIAVLRYTLQPVALGGTVIPAGEAVQVVYAAANRDPRRFEGPDLLDLSRPDNGHLGFGRGIHYCLGAALARAETQIALRSLVERFPRLALAVPSEEITWQPGMKRALTSLPVRTRG